ncbi:IS4 family transposase [Streptomyces sp. H27-G5]|uniref:IS4 family transposase n=1 Tax=Streptomyces sp. H27-G5 TaxID=2996698 RepID=UPI00226DAC82|nr:IS4 family transposase [Streptomyces sp. H27-G5]MCY0924454.1 IS4 family transposase [Streptomyces sp. H27-G5]
MGLLTVSVSRDVVDEAVAVHGRQARRSDAKLPPRLMVYYVMALALYADEDYEQVLAHLTERLADLGGWRREWVLPTSGGITQARQRLGSAVVAEVYERIAHPVADQLTVGAWLAGRRLTAIDGFTWEMPDSPANAERFGYPPNGGAFPQARVVTLSECGSHVTLGAAIAPMCGKGSGERTLAKELWPRLEEDWLLLADRGFYSFDNWCAAQAGGAGLLWRLSEGPALPVIRPLPDGSYLALVHRPQLSVRQKTTALQAARAGQDPDPAHARLVRVVEYDIPERGQGEAETICLITTLLDPLEATAGELAAAYHERWEHETVNAQIKTALRGPGRILRSKHPDTVLQEVYGYLLTHYAITAHICRAATGAGLDPDRVSFTRTLRILRRRVPDTAAFPPSPP